MRANSRTRPSGSSRRPERALGYKRKEIALSVASPLATLTAKDFTVEIVYALEESDATRYAVTTTLRELRDAGLARRDEFRAFFPPGFRKFLSN